MKKAILLYLNTFFGKDLELRVRLFHVLAITGVIICVIMTVVSVMGRMWASVVINAGAGLVSLALLLYSAKTNRYKFCYYMSIVVIFLILFPSLFFSGGGYKGGMPFFFVFAGVFTVYMLDGWPMLLVTLAELVFYSYICLVAYWYPENIIPFESEEAVVTDVIIGLVTVTVSLGATMFVQVRMYRKQQQLLETAQKEAEKANRAKSAFLANMSHEIRTPIHMILGMNEIIHRESRSSQVRDYSEKIDDTSKMLLSLVDSVLDVSKIESGKMELIPAAYESANLVRTMILIGRMNCKGKNLRFYTDICEDLPEQLYGDLAHIRQIASNLLSNAAKYTRQGSITLHISTEPSANPGEIILCLAIEDTGIGIKKEAIPTLFDAFSRADLADHRYIEGTGLGLKIVKELTALMGGTVSVESEPGVGSTFRVKLPQKVLAETHHENEACPMTFVAPGIRLLVVDDNEGNCNVMQELLTPTKMKVDAAYSGRECLEKVKQHPYDLILMDYMMPEMDGLETLHRLQQLPDFRTPVIALTADATAEAEQKLMSGGFTSYLTKPIPWPRLRDALLAVLPGELVKVQAEEIENGQEQTEELAGKLSAFGVAAEEALPYFDNSLKQYAAMAAIFLGHDAQEQKKVRTLWEAGDWAGLRYPIHALKGKARNLGVTRLANLSAYLENLCKAEAGEEICSLMPHLLYLWEQGRQGMELLVQEVKPGKKAPAQDSGSPEQLRGMLKEFRRKPSLECVRRMAEQENDPEGKQLLQKIEALIGAISFEEAEKVLDQYENLKKEGI